MGDVRGREVIGEEKIVISDQCQITDDWQLITDYWLLMTQSSSRVGSNTKHGQQLYDLLLYGI